MTRVTLMALALAALLLLTGCGWKASKPLPSGFRAPNPRELVDANATEQNIRDPWERFNRSMYTFNAQFDRVVFLPVVRTYETVAPKPVRQGVSNFFSNLDSFPSMVNCLLQGKFEGFFTTFDRMVINTTLGLGGFFDVASDMNLRKFDEDLGQTLGTYGLGTGPYLVLPLLGPSNVRDAAGAAGDFGMTAFEYDIWQTRAGLQYHERLGVSGVNAVNTRHQQSFRYYETGSPFEYTLIRYLYTKKRELDVEK